MHKLHGRGAFIHGLHATRVDVRAGILHWEPQSLALLKMPEEDRRAIAIECWELAADAGVPEARDCLKQARDVWDVKYE